MRVRDSYEVSVPIFRFSKGGLVNEIKSLVLKLYNRDEKKGKKNLGGTWSSKKNLHCIEKECIKELLRDIKKAIHSIGKLKGGERKKYEGGWLIEMWANLSKNNDAVTPHNHLQKRDTLWSGIYYIKNGAKGTKNSKGGVTIFESPIPKMPSSEMYKDNHKVSVRPDPGTIVIFPSSLPHKVTKYRAEEERISLSFNLYNPSMRIPGYRNHKGIENSKELKDEINTKHERNVKEIKEILR